MPPNEVDKSIEVRRMVEKEFVLTCFTFRDALQCSKFPTNIRPSTSFWPLRSDTRPGRPTELSCLWVKKCTRKWYQSCLPSMLFFCFALFTSIAYAFYHEGLWCKRNRVGMGGDRVYRYISGSFKFRAVPKV